MTIDLPKSLGGQGRGMAPPHLCIAALGGCAGVCVADFCDSQGIDYRGMRLNVWIAMAEAIDSLLPLGGTAAPCEDGACCRPAR